MTSPFSKPPGFIRGFDPVSDADVVVDLIADSFTIHNDQEGMRLLNQMRENARRARDDSWFLPNQGSHPGYVWIIDGQIVGNITIISFLERLRHIALIANVAVRPEFRGLGIASALTHQALRFAKAKRAWQVWLQVNDNNHAAQKMYEKLDFELVRRVNTWEIEDGRANLSEYFDLPRGNQVLPRKFWEWGKHKQWLRECYPPDTRWYATVNFSAFSPTYPGLLNWDDPSRLSHFSLHQNEKLNGILTWQQGLPRTDYLWLALQESPLENEQAYLLLAHFLQNEWEQRSIKVEYPGNRAEETFLRLGFKHTRKLNWMKLRDV
jgi:ribosomal protein S18 acetylase RimI-like enzyme